MDHHPIPSSPLPGSPPENAVVQDFVFGGIEQDDARLLAVERQRWLGLRHHHLLDPPDPLPGQPVTLTVSVGPDLPVDRVTAYVTTDGSDPAGVRGQARNGVAVPFHRVDVRWEPLLWDYVEWWQATLPGQPEGTLVHYRIEGWHSGSPDLRAWSQEPPMDRTVERPTLYGYHVDRHTTPEWARQAVVYHIFVDRFARGPHGEPVHPDWLPPERLTEFAGGDLPGVLARLDYIADLGVTAIWLSPIFQAASYHGYDTLDYTRIDPRFGNEDDLRRLVDAAHARGIRVILDFVANHVSAQAAFFQEALADPDSPYRAWFTFGPEYTHGYRTFFDVASMPQLNTDEPQVRRYLIQAARRWLTEFQVDGFRLDYAAGPSHAFWSAFRAACKQARPDCWLFGEVTRTGEILRTYLGRLDGCLDFNFLRRVRQLCAGPEPAIPLSRFLSHVERTRRYFPDDFLLPAFLDNHDTNRFLWVAGNHPERLRRALALLMAFGQAPVLYYGTEVGLSQPRPKASYREESRHPMPWHSLPDLGLYATTQALIRLRRATPALWQGTVETRYLDDGRMQAVVERRAEESVCWIGINLGREAAALPLPHASVVDGLSGQPVDGNRAWVPPGQVVFWLPA